MKYHFAVTEFGFAAKGKNRTAVLMPDGIDVFIGGKVVRLVPGEHHSPNLVYTQGGDVMMVDNVILDKSRWKKAPSHYVVKELPRQFEFSGWINWVFKPDGVHVHLREKDGTSSWGRHKGELILKPC